MDNDKLTSQEIIKLLENVIGDIEPCGDSVKDSKIFQNIITWEKITDYMLSRMIEVWQNTENDYQNSVASCHNSLAMQLQQLKKDLIDYGVE